MALGQVLLQVLRFCLVNFSPPMRHTHLNATSVRRTNGRSQGTIKESGVLVDDEEHWPEKYSQSIVFDPLEPFCCFTKDCEE